MHAEKLVPAVIAAVAVVCLLFAGRAHGQDGYGVPAAASQQMEEPQPNQKYLPQPQANDKYLPEPEAMPMPDLLKRPGFSLYAPSKTHLGDVSSLAGAFDGYIPKPTTTTEPEAEPAAETTTEPEPESEPAGMTEPEPEAEPAEETTNEPAEPEPEPAAETTREPEPVTPTAPGQGDFYRTGATPTEPKPPAKPTSPAPSDEKSSYTSGGGGGGKNQVDDDGEPVDGLSQNAIANILKEHNLFRAKEGEGPLTWNATVAKYAQQYAEKRKGDCALKHSTGPYGENLTGTASRGRGGTPSTSGAKRRRTTTTIPTPATPASSAPTTPPSCGRTPPPSAVAASPAPAATPSWSAATTRQGTTKARSHTNSPIIHLSRSP